jgi:hypothetical protein
LNSSLYCLLVIFFYPLLILILTHTNVYSKDPRGLYSSQVKVTAYLDVLVHLEAGQNQIPLFCYTYNQLGTNSNEVVNFAGEHIGQTSSNCYRQVADAGIAAWRVMVNNR